MLPIGPSSHGHDAYIPKITSRILEEFVGISVTGSRSTFEDGMK